MKKYPDAKYIHTTRNAESWSKSFSDTILKVSNPSLLQILKTMIRLPFSPAVRKRLPVFKFNGAMLKKIMGDRVKTKEGMIHRIELEIALTGALTPEQYSLLMQAAEKCPVHRTLTSEIDIKLRAAPADSAAAV